MIEMWVAGTLQEANGRLDQLEDRLSGTQEAGGSNPPASTLLLTFDGRARFARTFLRYARPRLLALASTFNHYLRLLEFRPGRF